MKKLVFLIILVFAVYSVNAQGYSSMSQEQLNLALEKANSKISTGATLTILGVITTGVGVALYVNGLTEMSEEDIDQLGNNMGKSMAGILVTVAGVGLIGGGIPTWATGKNKKDKIEIQLLKYKSTGVLYERNPSPIYGVGLKITF